MTVRIVPHAKAIILCDEVTRNVADRVVDLKGVRTTIRARSFPYRHRRLCIYLELTGHPARSSGFVTAVRADSEQEVFATETHAISLPNPLIVVPVVFRIHDCPFPEAGLYWIQFYCNEMLVVEHRLSLLREA